MRRLLLPVLFVCLVLGGCSACGPGHDGYFWAYTPHDDFGGIVWKSLANTGLAIFYTVTLGAYIIIRAGASGAGRDGIR
jgi:hypothetical protein